MLKAIAGLHHALSEALSVTDIMPLLQLAKIEDVATQNVPNSHPGLLGSFPAAI